MIIKTLIMLDLCLFIFRRLTYSVFHIRLKEVFVTVLIIHFIVALTKAIFKYILSIRKTRVSQSSKEQKGEVSDTYPNLRVIK